MERKEPLSENQASDRAVGLQLGLRFEYSSAHSHAVTGKVASQGIGHAILVSRSLPAKQGKRKF